MLVIYTKTQSMSKRSITDLNVKAKLKECHINVVSTLDQLFGNVIGFDIALKNVEAMLK